MDLKSTDGHSTVTQTISLGGSGIMVENVRAFNWSRTPLGPIAKWPTSLRVAVELCLNNRFPMHVWWGPELINIYNDGHIPVLGKRHPFALGQPASEVWEEAWHVLGPQVQRVLRLGESTWNARANVVLERQGFAEEAWFTWSYSPIRNEAGKIAGLMCIATEDTAAVLAERERDRLEALRQQQREEERAYDRAWVAEAMRESSLLLKGISDATSDAIFAKDFEGRLRLANPATLALVGKPLSEVLGKTDGEILDDKVAALAVMANDRAVMESGIATDVEEIVPLPDGTRRIWFSRKMPHRNADGKVVGLLGISRDITEQKEAEAALVRQADELARSNLELERFAHVASHDLQEPMRSVCSFAQLLQREYADVLKGDAQEYLGYITSGVTRMQALIVDLLALSRVGSEGAALVPVDCNDVVGKVLADLQASIECNHAHVQVDPLPHIIGDATQLGQLFQNLISNAIKFHGKRTPCIQVSATENDTEWIFSVADNGIGISPKYFERIFVIFQRLHTIEEYGGTGMGLAICKKIAERHGGRIWVESASGEGSTFRFSVLKRGKSE